ncbi:hypothetical protein [Streptomyces sp. NPDC002851]
MEQLGCGWTPPEDYVDAPEITGDPTDVILDLERSLAAYLTHPSWQQRETQQTAGPWPPVE